MKYSCDGCKHAPYKREYPCTHCGTYTVAADGEGTVYVYRYWTPGEKKSKEFMEPLSEELLKRIEKALGVSFYEWQRKYLLNEPMLLDMRMTGRCTGKTLVYIIKQLFESSEPLLLTTKKEIVRVADWWCCETRSDRTLGHHYLDWYRHELKGIYEQLNKAGIATREVIF